MRGQLTSEPSRRYFEVDGSPNKESTSKDKLSSTLDSKLKEEEETLRLSTVIETVRLKVKKYMTKSYYGKLYTQFMLIISVISCLEYIYQTYLTDRLEFQRMQLYYLGRFEMVLSCIFMFDWLLSYFLADHKFVFLTR